MTNLITEARELCEKWSLSDYAVFECEDCIANMVIYKVVELCDALEKAEEQNKQLVHEVCKLACESVEREKKQARLEAEVMQLWEAQRWRELEVDPCCDIGTKALLYGIGGIDEGEYLGEGEWQVAYGSCPGETFTHWMPLPAPPEEGETE